MDIQIGKVTHYYDKLGVAVVEIMNQSLKVGDTIKVSGHDKEFKQTIDSLQVEHKQVNEIAKGDSGAVKLDQPVKEGDVFYLVTTK